MRRADYIRAKDAEFLKPYRFSWEAIGLECLIYSRWYHLPVRTSLDKVLLEAAAIGILVAFATSVEAQRAGGQAQQTSSRPSQESYLKLGDEVDAMLRRDVLEVWFPRTVDHQHGGFNAHFSRDWQPLPSQGKFTVFQGRMTWVSS